MFLDWNFVEMLNLLKPSYQQLVQEFKKGKAFEGWSEGTLNFAPTYKYELNSEKYYGEDPKFGRRTPAWYVRYKFCYLTYYRWTLI